MEKPNFKVGPATNSENKQTKRKEVAAVWTKYTQQGEAYFRIKVVNENGDDIWLNAFKNRYKKEEEVNKPDYIAFEKSE